MDYIAFCRNYFDVTKIPVSLLKSGYVAYSSIAEHLSIEPRPSGRCGLLSRTRNSVTSLPISNTAGYRGKYGL